MIISSFVSNYIIPGMIFVGIAVFLAFGLAFLGEKLSVKTDEHVEEIIRLLPGINCGGCGYAGCSGFAAALNSGEANVSACKPASDTKKAQIAEVLGIKMENSEPKVAVVRCDGGKNCKDKGGYIGYGDCKSANLLAGGTKACSVGCMGLWACITACEFNAIHVNKDSATAVTNNNCTACGACVRECPKHLIGIIPRSAKVYVACSSTLDGKEINKICSAGCIACGICERVCKHSAIKVENNLAAIDYKKCTGCGECADKCPRHTILKR